MNHVWSGINIINSDIVITLNFSVAAIKPVLVFDTVYCKSFKVERFYSFYRLIGNRKIFPVK